jgi:hypothetical protein
MSDDVIANIRSRVERCRRLAGMITDAQAAAVLRQMAEEGEADIQRLQAERAERAAEPKA